VVKIPETNAPDEVAEFCDNKVKRLVRESVIDPNIYNGSTQFLSNDIFFLGKETVLDCVVSLKIKNSESYDRIPRRVLKYGINQLITPLSCLFKLIYETKTIPDQYEISKIITILKRD
jgi:hypothetical protein